MGPPTMQQRASRCGSDHAACLGVACRTSVAAALRNATGRHGMHISMQAHCRPREASLLPVCCLESLEALCVATSSFASYPYHHATSSVTQAEPSMPRPKPKRETRRAFSCILCNKS